MGLDCCSIGFRGLGLLLSIFSSNECHFCCNFHRPQLVQSVDARLRETASQSSKRSAVNLFNAPAPTLRQVLGILEHLRSEQFFYWVLIFVYFTGRRGWNTDSIGSSRWCRCCSISSWNRPSTTPSTRLASGSHRIFTVVELERWRPPPIGNGPGRPSAGTRPDADGGPVRGTAGTRLPQSVGQTESGALQPGRRGGPRRRRRRRRSVHPGDSSPFLFLRSTRCFFSWVVPDFTAFFCF